MFGRGCNIFLGAGLAILFIVIGSLYKDDCPGQPNLGPLLIISGSLALALCILELLLVSTCIAATGDRDFDERTACVKFLGVVSGLIAVAKLILFLYLCLVVYKFYPNVNYDDQSNENYCNETLFMTVFLSITISLVLAGIAVLFAVCALCSIC